MVSGKFIIHIRFIFPVLLEFPLRFIFSIIISVFSVNRLLRRLSSKTKSICVWNRWIIIGLRSKSITLAGIRRKIIIISESSSFVRSLWFHSSSKSAIAITAVISSKFSSFWSSFTSFFSSKFFCHINQIRMQILVCLFQ